MPLKAPVGMGLLVVPALGIDAVDAIELQLPALNSVGDARHHPVIFVLKKAAHGGGKDQDPGPGVPEAQQLHIPVEILRPPAIICALHPFANLQNANGTRYPAAPAAVPAPTRRPYADCLRTARLCG